MLRGFMVKYVDIAISERNVLHETRRNVPYGNGQQVKVFGATINGMTDTFKLMNGTANVIRLENAVFGGQDSGRYLPFGSLA